MHLTRSIFAAILLVAALATPLRAQDEKAAIESFKKQMAEMKAQVEVEKAAAKAHPSGGLAVVRSMVAKVKGIKVDGMPTDFKDAFNDLVKTMEKLDNLMKDFPEKAEEVEGFLKKKSQEDPKYMEGLMEKVQALFAEGDIKNKKLEEIGKKYGLEKVL